MTNNLIEKNFKYNVEYIYNHKLSDKKIGKAGIELLAVDEVFVQYPKWRDYYVSNYGRCVSIKGKNKRLRIAKPYQNGDGYLAYQFSKFVHRKQKTKSITVHRAVATIFCPNYWNKDTKLEAHHLDHSKDNNYYKNLILLPKSLHTVMNGVLNTAIFQDGDLRKMNPLDIADKTGLTIDDIIGVAKGRKWTADFYKLGYGCFSVDCYIIGFEFNYKNPRP
ncbi:MAG: hypothetical protein LUF92_03690 [Clostridiales bacterium]|nr:hypothetical protein [Clostridiales bacterium]